MEELAKKEKGYLGIESARNEIGITVSYWKDLDSIKTWKENVVHKVAQEKGKEGPSALGPFRSFRVVRLHKSGRII